MTIDDAVEYAIADGCSLEGEGPNSSTIEGSSSKVSLVRFD
jgi:hypothetical protein